MRKFVLWFLALLFLFASGCSKYSESNFIGKTAAQIQEQYGAFDLPGASFVSIDSTYWGYGYGYIAKESQVGFLGTTPAEYFLLFLTKTALRWIAIWATTTMAVKRTSNARPYNEVFS